MRPRATSTPRDLWPEFASDGVHILDGDTAVIGGLKAAFVGGALLPDDAVLRDNGVWRPYLRYERSSRRRSRACRMTWTCCARTSRRPRRS